MELPGVLWRDVRGTVVGAAVGIAAFLAGFVATFVLQRDEFAESPALGDELAAVLGPDLGDVAEYVADWLQPEPVEAVGWFFYASHYVDLEVTVTTLGRSMRWTADLQQTPLWDDELALVPPLVLLTAGYLFARWHHGRGGSALACGVRLAFGYAAAASAGVSVVSYSRDAGFARLTAVPDLVTAVVYTATYALVFGTAGALLYDAYGPKNGARGTLDQETSATGQRDPGE
ncbi:hypothetical protein [Halobacterium bonnevillei]|uniref:DUF7978 domain-containing protein n=1 Tax=Halobacterium bonnevillei TaxID=2692200 RepID=A0A6B0SQ05_9EURY|nr:hypothetical protein [Halobacterium bonnevillei]MXR21711.1 hypothetical protein [Halobacterium bonnevillei]